MPDDKTVKDVFDSFTEEQKNVVYYLIAEAVDNATSEIIPTYKKIDDFKAMYSIFDSFTEEQKNVVYYLIAEAVDNATSEMIPTVGDINPKFKEEK